MQVTGAGLPSWDQNRRQLLSAERQEMEASDVDDLAMSLPMPPTTNYTGNGVDEHVSGLDGFSGPVARTLRRTASEEWPTAENAGSPMNGIGPMMVEEGGGNAGGHPHMVWTDQKRALEHQGAGVTMARPATSISGSRPGMRVGFPHSKPREWDVPVLGRPSQPAPFAYDPGFGEEASPQHRHTRVTSANPYPVIGGHPLVC